MSRLLSSMVGSMTVPRGGFQSVDSEGSVCNRASPAITLPVVVDEGLTRFVPFDSACFITKGGLVSGSLCFFLFQTKSVRPAGGSGRSSDFSPEPWGLDEEPWWLDEDPLHSSWD